MIFSQEEINKRSQYIDSHHVMESGPGLSLDHLTHIAANISETPIALLSFFYQDKQKFCSTFGMDIDELPFYVTPCNEVLSRGDIYIIENAQLDNSLYGKFVTELGYSFYAGVPIFSADGLSIGSLCVIDKVPRKADHIPLETLTIISKQISDLIELKMEYEENLQELKDVESDLFQNQKVLQDVTYKAVMKSRASLCMGIIFRLRPLSNLILRSLKELEVKDSSSSNKYELINDAVSEINSILSSMEKFILAEKEKWMKPLELEFLLKKVLKLLEYEITSRDIEIEVQIEGEIHLVGNMTQIADSLYAILINAIEAVENVNRPQIHVRLLSENHLARLWVSDNGKGVSEEIRNFIFQPFFTTKGNHNLGLGLSLARDLIRRHNGSIFLEKAKDPTTFRVDLPFP